MNLPGLASETSANCQNLDIEDVNITTLDKSRYKAILKKAAHKENEKRLRALASGKEKCNKILNEEYGRKYYFFEKNIHEARLFYKTRVSMLPFAGNFSHYNQFSKTN